jgi:hypothetical protein
LRPLTPVAMRALLDPPLLEAFAFKPAPAWLRVGVERAVRLRSRLARTLVRRSEPLLRTNMKPHTYPQGYDVTKIGPAKCPFRS